MYEKVYLVLGILLLIAMILATCTCSNLEIARIQDQNQTLKYQLKIMENKNNIWERSKLPNNSHQFDLIINIPE